MGKPRTAHERDDFATSGFGPRSSDEGLSLDELSQAYAQILSRGAEPYEPAAPESGSDDRPESESQPCEPADERIGASAAATVLPAPDREAADEGCELSPRTILEAMLFVGHPQNLPLTSREVAALMRGVRPAEIDELVRELNAAYDAEGCPYTIVSEGAGYRLCLREQFAALRDRFYGRTREARLSQAAIDTLAIVAYNQPVTRDEIDRLRGKPSGGILAQLIRRELLRIERPEQRPRKPRYFTTERFLDVFGLDALGDLPQSHDLER
jgi:segregation and condensation protein B